ncbi:MAG: rRNA pseudouridine synthase [Gemmatimonadetes bacterium]|nr:rRNA pseudouridine synthase [Gemmatimonadota bacterium]
MSPAGMRLNKFLSRAGVASRRDAEGLLLAGRVRVNGDVVRTLGTSVDPTADRIAVDGREVRLEPFRWILLNKPSGVLTTRRDPGGRPTVYSLLDPEDAALPYVGRLDRDTEGLLLFTNEGDVLHGLTHPSSEIAKEYHALIAGVPSKETRAALEAGIELEDGPARAENVRVVRKVGADGSILSLVLREGRKREVRRMLDAVGHRAKALRRVSFGPLRLGNLPLGEWRELDPSEVVSLRRAVG